MIKEFKEFISKGNVLDLAVAVIIGAAIGKIVSSLVNDIIMPIIGAVFGGINLESLRATIGNASINYGVFLQSVVDFFIIALSIFILVKLMKRAKKEKVKQATPPEPSRQEVLLTEIRDLLKKDSE